MTALRAAISPTEDERIDDALRRERAGEPLPTLAVVKDKTRTHGESLPIEPFRAWLREVEARVAATEKLEAGLRTRRMRANTGQRIAGRVAASMGVTPRRLYGWLHEKKTIDFCTVDRAASRHGGITVEEIYRTYGNGTTIKFLSDGSFGGVDYKLEPEIKEVTTLKTKTKTTCRSPGCREQTIKRGRFCKSHAASLARVKKSLEDETNVFRSTIGRKGTRSTCCNPACRAPRLQGERYCDRCQEEGWNEEDLL